MEYPAIRAFLQNHYSDEKLAALLAHAEDGKLAYHSCCCFVGVSNANHSLRTHGEGVQMSINGEHSFVESAHCLEARSLPSAELAEDEFYDSGKTDAERRAKLIPLIHEEMERRERLRAEGTETTAEKKELEIGALGNEG
jgi:hypothetical protein